MIDLTVEAANSLFTLQLAEVTLTPGRGVGRLHPLAVHFPIAFVFAAAFLEVARAIRREPGMHAATPGLLVAAALTGCAAAATGWLNAAFEYANEQTAALFWHRWIGTFAAILLVAVAAWSWRARRDDVLASSQSAGRLGALVLALIIAVVGHIGGELVRGEGHVLEGFVSRQRELPAPRQAPSPPAPVGPAVPVLTADERFFVDRVQPILAAHCVECHGPRKQKGGLRLDPITAAFEGDPATHAILPGDPDASELIVRVLLPADDADAMPPDGERLSADDIEALREWIRKGAIVPADHVEPGNAERSEVEPDGAAQASRADAIRAIAARGGSATALSGDSRLLRVNASTSSEPWTDGDLRLLAPLAGHVAQLDLARSLVTDAGLSTLQPLGSLEDLRLDATAVGDAGIEALLRVTGLRRLSLVGTRITDEGLLTLAAHPELRVVYVFETPVTEEGLRMAMSRHPDLTVVGDTTTTSLSRDTVSPAPSTAP